MSLTSLGLVSNHENDFTLSLGIYRKDTREIRVCHSGGN